MPNQDHLGETQGYLMEKDNRCIPGESLQSILQAQAERAWEEKRLARVEEKLDRLLALAEGRMHFVPGIGWGTLIQ